MTSSSLRLALVAVFTLAGCQSADQILDEQDGVATQAALNRGKFELSCPHAQA